jgi:hypothetical protein
MKPKKKPNLIGLNDIHIMDEPIPEYLNVVDPDGEK